MGPPVLGSLRTGAEASEPHSETSPFSAVSREARDLILSSTVKGTEEFWDLEQRLCYLKVGSWLCYMCP